MQEMQVRALGWEDPLEKEMASHSSVLAWDGSLAGYIVHGVTERLRCELMTIQQSVVLYDSKCEECFPFSCDFLEFLILVHHSYMHFSWTVSFNSYNSCIFGSALLSQIFLVYMD